MAVNVSETRQERDRRLSDWDSFIESLSWPAGLSVKERRNLYKHGCEDGKHKRVSINEYGEISSPFCEELVQEANQSIVLEWKKCADRSVDAQVEIDRAKVVIADVRRKIADATVRKDEELQALRNWQRSGDAAVSEHLAQRRQYRREKPIIDRFDALSRSLNAQMDEAQTSLFEAEHALDQVKDDACSREMYIRARFLRRLSVYAHGAATQVKITPDMINNSALTDEPREQYMRRFGDIAEKHDD